jgi:hypothetical protein
VNVPRASSGTVTVTIHPYRFDAGLEFYGHAWLKW